MFIETIKTDGLAHLSYVLGDGGRAAVVDPRRDCEAYLARARARGCSITHVLETHRNEDLVSGAALLARRTGAEVLHGPRSDGKVAYARTIREGHEVALGSLRLQALETPGHTDDSLSFALYDQDFGEDAVGVLTGDALFVGDVGRTDFYPDRAAEVAGLLFDSLRKLLALGDQAIVYPAHGAGSVCGNAMADREFSTIGYERLNNPMLQVGDRQRFVERKLSEHHYQPPYFRLMERLNLEGCEREPGAAPPPLDAAALQARAERPRPVDVRGVTAFLGAHLPGSLAIPDDMLSAFAGWLLDPEEELLLIAENRQQAESAALDLARIGYDRIAGYLDAALTGWAAAARPFRSLPVLGVDEVARRVAEAPAGWTLLDVRGASEFDGGHIEGARHAYVGELPRQIDRLDPTGSYTVMCASGARATIAASVLLDAGFENVSVFLGSMGAWRAAGRPVSAP